MQCDSGLAQRLHLLQIPWQPPPSQEESFAPFPPAFSFLAASRRWRRTWHASFASAASLAASFAAASASLAARYAWWAKVQGVGFSKIKVWLLTGVPGNMMQHGPGVSGISFQPHPLQPLPSSTGNKNNSKPSTPASRTSIVTTNHDSTPPTPRQSALLPCRMSLWQRHSPLRPGRKPAAACAIPTRALRAFSGAGSRIGWLWTWLQRNATGARSHSSPWVPRRGLRAQLAA